MLPDEPKYIGVDHDLRLWFLTAPEIRLTRVAPSDPFARDVDGSILRATFRAHVYGRLTSC
jgi:hypothetical protein